MKNKTTIVAIMLKRLPMLEDFKAVNLCSGTESEIYEYGLRLVNALMPQFNNSLRHELSTDCSAARAAKQPVIHFECDVPDYMGAWCLPAAMFTIRENPYLKDVKIYKGVYNYLVKIDDDWFEMNDCHNPNGLNMCIDEPLLSAADELINRDTISEGLEKNIQSRINQ